MSVCACIIMTQSLFAPGPICAQEQMFQSWKTCSLELCYQTCDGASFEVLWCVTETLIESSYTLYTLCLRKNVTLFIFLIKNITGEVCSETHMYM